MLRIDHLQVEASDFASSARLLAELLGTGAPTPEGADDDMLRVDLDDGVFLSFVSAERPREVHVAFRVDAKRFADVVGRLRARGIAFGNDHADTDNGETSDPLGGEGRVYFVDVDGHLWEVAC